MLLMNGPIKQDGQGSDDWDLANQARTDPRNLDLLFRRHRDFVYRAIWAQVGHKAVAEDLTQEVFIRVATGRRKLFRRAAFRTWLYRVAANLVRDHRRKHRWELDDSGLEGQVGESSQQNLMDILKAIDRLARRQREVVLLRILEGMSTEETADLLGISQGSVKTHLHRGLEHLKTELS